MSLKFEFNSHQKFDFVISTLVESMLKALPQGFQQKFSEYSILTKKLRNVMLPLRSPFSHSWNNKFWIVISSHISKLHAQRGQFLKESPEIKKTTHTHIKAGRWWSIFVVWHPCLAPFRWKSSRTNVCTSLSISQKIWKLTSEGG